MSDSEQDEPPPQATAWLARDSWARVVKLEREVARLSALLIGGDGTNGLRANVRKLETDVAPLVSARWWAIGAGAALLIAGPIIGVLLSRYLFGGS